MWKTFFRRKKKSRHSMFLLFLALFGSAFFFSFYRCLDIFMESFGISSANKYKNHWNWKKKKRLRMRMTMAWESKRIANEWERWNVMMKIKCTLIRRKIKTTDGLIWRISRQLNTQRSIFWFSVFSLLFIHSHHFSEYIYCFVSVITFVHSHIGPAELSCRSTIRFFLLFRYIIVFFVVVAVLFQECLWNRFCSIKYLFNSKLTLYLDTNWGGNNKNKKTITTNQ